MWSPLPCITYLVLFINGWRKELGEALMTSWCTNSSYLLLHIRCNWLALYLSKYTHTHCGSCLLLFKLCYVFTLLESLYMTNSIFCGLGNQMDYISRLPTGITAVGYSIKVIVKEIGWGSINLLHSCSLLKSFTLHEGFCSCNTKPWRKLLLASWCAILQHKYSVWQQI